MEEFYRNWIQLQQNEAEHENDDPNNEEQDINEAPTNIIYETQDLKLIVEQGVHKRQRVFRLQDHVFYIKIVPKVESQPPLLSDLLDFLHAGFVHILDEIKKFYNVKDHQIAYMTLTQKPMVNGLNTGGYDLQDSNAAAEMTDRLLSMLYQFLLSNQSLVLNDTFKVYLKILSIDHMRYHQLNQPR